MKQVTLIGDSIRGGYQEYVQKELQGQAAVWGPEENGRHSVHILVNLHPWLLKRAADVVHINCGLHDLKTIVFGGRETVVPVEYYRRNLLQILQTVQKHTKAKLIWATTTPINERKAHNVHARVADFDRFGADVAVYNKAALEVCEKLGVPVNDLHAVVMNAGRDRLLTEDGVHFTPEGCALLGKTVADAIRKQL